MGWQWDANAVATLWRGMALAWQTTETGHWFKTLVVFAWVETPPEVAESMCEARVQAAVQPSQNSFGRVFRWSGG